MGFLAQDTNNIIIDAVLTDLGRQKLAAGTFSIIKFAAGDDEVDYGMITRYGRTVGQESVAFPGMSTLFLRRFVSR